LKSDQPVFTSLDFVTIIILKSKVVVSLASNPQPRRPGLCIYVPQWQGGPVIPRDTGFPSRRLLQLAWLRWRYLSCLRTGWFTYFIDMLCLLGFYCPNLFSAFYTYKMLFIILFIFSYECKYW
jgi:hypothetical protein